MTRLTQLAETTGRRCAGPLRTCIAGVSAAAWLFAGIAVAQQAPAPPPPAAAEPPRQVMAPEVERAAVVLELFTSQGCSACPPADAFFSQLAVRQDVIALALHVDYWDYIGWADPFADPRFTARQQAYARSIGEHTVYTPQVVVSGQHRIEGFRTMQLMDLIDRHRAHAGRVRVDLDRVGDSLTVTTSTDTPLEGPVDLHLIRYRPMETVDITAGENQGRTLTYHNIVTDWQTVATWNGEGTHVMDLTVTGPDPVVVVVQRPEMGQIIGSARLR